MWKLFLDNTFDSPGCLKLSQGGLRLSREGFSPLFGASLLWLRRGCWTGAALGGACAEVRRQGLEVVVGGRAVRELRQDALPLLLVVASSEH